MNNDIEIINQVFNDFGISVTDTVRGSQTVRYKLKLPNDVKLQGKIRRAEKDIDYALKTALKDNTVVYGKYEDCVYIEKKADTFNVVKFQNHINNVPKKGLYLLLGKDIDGHILYTDLEKAPHILVAGTTGSGKSELLHCFIASLLYKRDTSPCYICIIDPKRAEFSDYKNRNGIDVLTDMSAAVNKLKWAVDLMESRYQMLEQKHCKDIAQLNDPSVIPYVIVIDEIADLIMSHRESEQYMIRLAQKARACGIHLILGTQSPRRDVITGLIKANIPTKCALKCANKTESRIIFDQNGAEKLFGFGDMLFLANGSFNPIRIQGAYVSPEVRKSLVSRFSYKPTQQEQPTQQYSSDPRVAYMQKYYPNNPEMARVWMEYRQEQMQQQPKRQKSTGLFKGFFNLFTAKPVMFRTDDYPPKI